MRESSNDHLFRLAHLMELFTGKILDQAIIAVHVDK